MSALRRIISNSQSILLSNSGQKKEHILDLEMLYLVDLYILKNVKAMEITVAICTTNNRHKYAKTRLRSSSKVQKPNELQELYSNSSFFYTNNPATDRSSCAHCDYRNHRHKPPVLTLISFPNTKRLFCEGVLSKVCGINLQTVFNK